MNATSTPDLPRILVLDDEAEIRNMLRRYLTDQGFEVRAVEDHAQLATQLQRQPYDLLILDLMMPARDGLDVCRDLRAAGHTIPILMLTARGDGVVAGDVERVRFGDFVLDLRRQELTRDGTPIDVGSIELRLLCALAATPNRPVSRDTLLERVRGRDHDVNTRAVDVQVLRLRQVIEADASSPRHIRTVWGRGYMLVAEAAP